MKSKDNKRFYDIFCIRVLPLILLLFILLSGSLMQISAENEEGSIIAENYKLSDEALNRLGNVSSYYTGIDTSSEKSVSLKVSDVIVIYRKKLLEIPAHEDANTRILSGEINALEEKGKAAGRLAWIYYYNLPSLSNPQSAKAIEEKYTAYLDEIQGESDSAVISARADEICYEMNRAIYSEKIKNLSLESDSIDSSGLIEGTLSSIQNSTDYSLFATELSQTFSELTSALLLQRTRDSLMEQIRSVFPTIRPNEEADSDKTVALLYFELKKSSTVSDMNKKLADTLCTFIQTPAEDMPYLEKYLSYIRKSVADNAARASNNNKCMNILPIFEEYTTDFKRAETKDRIRTVIFEGIDKPNVFLISLESEFNQNGGLVDQSKQDSFSSEIVCAKYRRMLYDETESAKISIATILGNYDATEFYTRTEELFEEYSKELLKVRSSQTEAEKLSIETLKKARVSYLEIINETKAEKYLLDNKTVIEKGVESIGQADELLLRRAITEYLKLENSVKASLSRQIENIAEKYNILTAQKIRSLIVNDSLYYDLCENLQNQLKNLNKSNIDVFYNNCDMIFVKAQRISAIVLYYRELLVSPVYENCENVEKELLLSACKDGAAAITEINLSTAEISGKIQKEYSEAILDLERCRECTKIRVSARGSELSTIQDLITDACAKIKASKDKSEMIAIAEKAVFKIERELTKNAIISLSDELKLNISKMEFLPQSDKDTFFAQIAKNKDIFSADASEAQNITVLTFAWNNFDKNLRNCEKDAAEKNLELAKDAYTKTFEKEVEKAISDIEGLQYLLDERCTEFCNSSSKLLTKFKVDIISFQKLDEVVKSHDSSLEDLANIISKAQSENLGNYKIKLSIEFAEMLDTENEYSAENYNIIKDQITLAKENLKTCKTLSECSELLEKVKGEIEKINNLLDDAKEKATATLTELLNSCRANEGMYSKENILKIESIFAHASAAISEYSDISEVTAVEKALANFILQITNVNKDITFTNEDALGILGENPSYPKDYNFSTGYWGSISRKDGIPGNSLFTIKNDAGADLDAIRNLINKQAKDGKIIFSDKASDSLLSLLGDCEVSLGVKIALSPAPLQSNGSYNIKMLLPSALASDTVLGVVLIDGDLAEFYTIEQSGDLISFDISKFSSFYIVTEGVTNLYPLIIFLIILLCIEILVLLLLTAIHLKRKKKERNMTQLISSYSIAPMPLFALRVEPQNGTSLAILLTLAALALGCGIAIFAKLELKEATKTKARTVKASARRRKNKELIEEQKNVERIENTPLREKIPILCATADGMIDVTEATDFDVEAIREEEYDEPTYAEEHFVRRAEVNLDVIAKHFASGELVTLEALKRKRLVNKHTDYIKILARGTLTKPLIIEAHDFSHTAEEMLKAVGGEAIKITK